ncbi:hypothetical protein PCANC_02744 [Puccinia coronata f. sp. avenae]|uniref:Uncharacterized protein n=1 Tax=Puccinia coronata f. sp. avenae TaxID=200324 RepID=A0A2N5VYD4_9BASI|nr:hypothetical protein PCANC_02744 [Puccinia coronata f. sp. avenae]
MHWNFARSLPGRSVACVGYIALSLEVVRAMPPIRGSLAENHYAAGDLHSIQGGQDRVLDHAGFMYQKRPPEDQLTNSRLVVDLSSYDINWENYAVPGEFREANLGNHMMSNVAKRQRTMQDGYGADHVPDLGHGSDASLLTGPTLQPMFKPVTIEEHELSQMFRFPSVSTSQPSPWSQPSHDAPYHGSSSFAAEHFNLPSQEAGFQASSPHQSQTPDDDHHLSRVLELLQSHDLTNFNEWSISFLNHADQAHPPLPVPESTPENNQGHGLQEHFPFQQNPYGSQDSTHPGISNQLWSQQEIDQSFLLPSGSATHAWPYPSHDAPYHGDLNFPGEHSHFLTHEARFQPSPPHQPAKADHDHTISQVLELVQSSDFTNFDEWSLSFLNHADQAHPPLPVPESTPENNRRHGLQEHPPSQQNPHGSQDSAPPTAVNQIQSHQPFEDHTINQVSDLTPNPFNPPTITPGSSTSHPSGTLLEQLSENRGALWKDSAVDARLNAKLGAQVFNKLPKDGSNGDQPIFKSPTLNFDLESISFPHESVNIEYLDRFASKFVIEASDILKETGKVPLFPRFKLKHALTDHLTDHYHVDVFEIPSSDRYHIRIHVNDGPIIAKPPARKPGLARFNVQFNQLTGWLLLINTAIWRKLNPTEAKGDAEFDFNEKLIDSLVRETFRPEKGLPAFGAVEPETFDKIQANEAFGKIPKLLTEFLSSRRSSDKALSTALSLVQLYYQDTKPEMLVVLGIWTLADLHRLTKGAVDSGIMISNELDEPHWAEKLGDFSIRKLRDLPDSLRPSNPKIKSQYDPEVKLGTKEDKILLDFKNIFPQKRFNSSGHQKLTFEPDNFPVVMTQIGTDGDERSLGFVRLKNRRSKNF